MFHLMSYNSHTSSGRKNNQHLCTSLVVTIVIAIIVQNYLIIASATNAQNKLTISTSGINLPKRPTIIAGLNQQFKNRQNGTTAASLASPIAAIIPTAHSTASNSVVGSSKVSGLLAAIRFGSRPAKSAASNVSLSSGFATSTGLYMDRYQQELLAANPNLPAANLLTRSDAPSQIDNQRSQASQLGGSTSGIVQRLLAQANQASIDSQSHESITANHSSGQNQASQKDSQKDALQQPQQSYRGYSLIELEVKSESDRRYVQDLYGNLSAALNEQAQRPQTLTVSPYVDIDFWSFKTALNDQIDIMVSPKSRAFILAQLSRAKIKHRIKIDDIQSRLDQQALQPTPGAAPTGSNNNHELSGRQSSFNAEHLNQFNSKNQNQQENLNGRQQGANQFSSSSGFMNDSLFFENYQRLADINQYLESIVARARDISRVQVIGRSSQGRYLRVLRLGYEQQDLDGSTGPLFTESSNRVENDELLDKQKPDSAPVSLNATLILDQFFKRQQGVKKVGSLWLDGGTHAREWISPATVLYMAFRLSDNHAKCLRFFDYLRMVVNQQQLNGRSYFSTADQTQLDKNLLNGINEINTSLLSGQKLSAKPRARTELEQKLELLAKRPQEVASEHGCDLELDQLLRKYTLYIMPVLNPDGYEYSHTHNRLWRKTRSTSNHPIYRHFCLGADPNRNYDARHGSTGSSSHPCSQTYGGLTPFTEPETRHQSNFVYAHRDSLKMYISFHSYSQMILLPFSHSKQLAPDHKDLESVGQAAVRAIERTHGTQYKVGPSASILYTASGTASDWAYEKAGIKYSYTIELRDTGTNGFLLPRQQIVPTGEETFNGLLAMIQQMELNENLLTSKSGKPSSSSVNNTNQVSTSSSEGGLVHAPDLDQLRPFGRFRPKPAQLENVIDGSDTWATPEPKQPGVRDRAPLVSDERQKFATIGEDFDSTNRVIEDEVVSMAEEEPDAGLAFEGEGELMEPTNNLSVNSALNGQSSEAAAQSAAKLMGHIYAHSASDSDQLNDLQGRRSSHSTNSALDIRQKIHSHQHQLGLSANGRSLINSPPGPSRSISSTPQKRESSNQVQL